MKRFTLLLVLAIPILSCSQKSSFPPAGSYSNIVLVTETGEPGGLNDIIIKELQHPVDYYSKMEIQFKLRMISAYDVQDEPPTKNMVVFGVAREGRIGTVIEGFLGTNAVRKVLEGKNHIFKKMDYPYTGQLTVIVTASSHDRLRKVIEENGQVIRDIIEDGNRERLRNYLLTRDTPDLTAELKARHGFEIRIPSLYELNQEKDDVPGIELVRKHPHRGITISWKYWDKNTLSSADSTRLYDIRADLAWKMYDKDVMRKDLVFYHDTMFGPYEAVRMDGYWENSEDMFGGPFICFFVHDRARKRIWLVDCLVYAPGFDKHKLLREVLSIAETFRIN